MTITLELTQEQEGRLIQQAQALGLPPQEYLRRLIDEPQLAESVGARLKRLGILGGFSGAPRTDGKPWSEIEGFE